VTAGERPRLRVFVALVPVYLSVFLFVAGNSALSILIPVFLARQRGLGPATIGAVIGAFGFASLAARLPTGMAYSVRRAAGFLLVGGGLSALAFALVPLVHGTAAFTALMVVNGVGWSVATTAQLALLVARPPGGISTTEAMGWFSGATGLGNLAAGVLGGLTADVVGLRTTFFVLAATPLVGALLMVRGVGASTEIARGGGSGDLPHRPGTVWRLLVRMPVAVWIGVLVMFFINALNGITNTFQPVMCLTAGLSLTQIGALSSIRSWASSSSRLGSGPLFSRFDISGLTLPLVIAGAVATAVIPDVRTSFLLQIPLFVVAGLSRGLLRVTGSADAFESVGGEDRQHGITSALLYAGLDLGKIAGPVIGGAVAAVWGIPTMFRVVPLAFLALYLVLIAAARRIPGATTPVPSERRAGP
jgi:MFS family permease